MVLVNTGDLSSIGCHCSAVSNLQRFGEIVPVAGTNECYK